MPAYVIINFPAEVEESYLHQNNIIFFEQVASTLNKILDYEITNQKKIILMLRESEGTVYASMDELHSKISPSLNFEIIIEYDAEKKHILAIHDLYFSRNSEGNFHCARMDNLYVCLQKYTEIPIDRKRFIDSIAYGFLAEIAEHNSIDLNYYTRGLLLSDYLYKNHPKESYKITRKILMTAPAEQVLSFFKENKKIVNRIKDWITPLPQINPSNFDAEDFSHMMMNYGSFELVGSCIEKLKKLAFAVLDKSKEIFNLPEAILKETEHDKDFNGYKNLYEESKDNSERTGKGIVLHQQGYFYKPYDPRVPKGVDSKILNEYYQESIAILQCLYRLIVIKFKVDPNIISSYSDDRQSLLSLKRYSQTEKDKTGIQAHSDYGLLTLVVSNQSGLEVETGEGKDKKWISAPHEPQLRFFVNVGDWLLFQLNNKSFRPGNHRVLGVSKERFSAMTFLLPSPDEKLQTPKGVLAKYGEYLFSDKSAYLEIDPDPVLHPYIQQKKS